jgi:ornithine carbamoyltransferase
MKHFLDLADWSSTELQQMIELAVTLKREWHNGGNQPVLAGKTLGMIFQKPSLRTRLSFDVGMYHLGGYAVMMGPQEIGLGQRESIADVARVMSGMVQCVMARVFDHAHVLQLAEWSSVPIINGLSDDRHPCQAMADILTIYEHFGRTEGLRVTFVGDGNNVAASLLLVCAHFGAHFTIAAPDGYDLPKSVMARAGAINPNIEIRTLRDPIAAVKGADVVYTDTWVSMGQEEEARQRQAAFADYQLNAALLAHAGEHTIVMHDLPAYRGKEITDEVADGPQSVIFQQAANRLHAQKAILVTLMR